MESDKNEDQTNSNTKKENSNSLIFKIVILGDSGVGKTSILHYYVFNKCKN
jgi:GTPase SAR1 family protein